MKRVSRNGLGLAGDGGEVENKKPYDKLIDGDYVSDKDLLDLMYQLDLLTSITSKMGKAWSMAYGTAAIQFSIASNMADARGLTYK